MNMKLAIQNVAVVILVIIAIFILFFEIPTPEGTMTREEINSEIRNLTQITSSNKTEGEKISELKELAKRVGAGTVNTKIVGGDTHKEETGATIARTFQNPISEAELVQNINQALQTHMLFDSCRTANQQYKMAVLAAIIALGSVLVTWNISKRRT